MLRPRRRCTQQSSVDTYCVLPPPRAHPTPACAYIHTTVQCTYILQSSVHTYCASYTYGDVVCMYTALLCTPSPRISAPASAPACPVGLRARILHLR